MLAPAMSTKEILAALEDVTEIVVDSELLCVAVRNSVITEGNTGTTDTAPTSDLLKVVGTRIVAATKSPLDDVCERLGHLSLSHVNVAYRALSSVAAVHVAPVDAAALQSFGATFLEVEDGAATHMVLLATEPGTRADESGLGRYSGGLWRVKTVGGVVVRTAGELANAVMVAEGFSIVLSLPESCTARVRFCGTVGEEDTWLPTKGQLLSFFAQFGTVCSVLPAERVDVLRCCTPCGAVIESTLDSFCSDCGAKAPPPQNTSDYETYATFKTADETATCVNDAAAVSAFSCTVSTAFDYSSEVCSTEVPTAAFSDAPIQGLLHRHGFFNPFFVLNVPLDATSAEVNKAYRRLALQWHPDKQHGTDVTEECTRVLHGVCLEDHPFSKSSKPGDLKLLFQWIGTAKEVLLDTDKRAALMSRVQEAEAEYGSAVRKVFPQRG